MQHNEIVKSEQFHSEIKTDMDPASSRPGSLGQMRWIWASLHNSPRKSNTLPRGNGKAHDPFIAKACVCPPYVCFNIREEKQFAVFDCLP